MDYKGSQRKSEGYGDVHCIDCGEGFAGVTSKFIHCMFKICTDYYVNYIPIKH